MIKKINLYHYIIEYLQYSQKRDNPDKIVSFLVFFNIIAKIISISNNIFTMKFSFFLQL